MSRTLLLFLAVVKETTAFAPVLPGQRSSLFSATELYYIKPLQFTRDNHPNIPLQQPIPTPTTTSHQDESASEIVKWKQQLVEVLDVNHDGKLDGKDAQVALAAVLLSWSLTAAPAVAKGGGSGLSAGGGGGGFSSSGSSYSSYIGASSNYVRDD